MKNLSEIIKSIDTIEIIGNTEISITEIVFDSRKVISDCVFVATKGTHVDGHQFISKAIDKGAKVIVCQDIPLEISAELVYIKVENTTSTSHFV